MSSLYLFCEHAVYPITFSVDVFVLFTNRVFSKVVVSWS